MAPGKNYHCRPVLRRHKRSFSYPAVEDFDKEHQETLAAGAPSGKANCPQFKLLTSRLAPPSCRGQNTSAAPSGCCSQFPSKGVT